MKYLKNKHYWIIASIIMILSLLRPVDYTINHETFFNEYNYGAVFPFLSLRIVEPMTGSLNIFKVVSVADNFEFNISNFLGSALSCYLIAYLLVVIYRKLFV
jgi:hypothetical protein